MAYDQGSVVLAPATFKGGMRPSLVVSNEYRPFHGDRYTVAVVTSTEREPAVPLTEETLVEGEFKTYPSFASPWSLHAFPTRRSPNAWHRSTGRRWLPSPTGSGS